MVRNRINLRDAVVEITVNCQLKLTKCQELPNKKAAENPIFTDCFIVFYCSYENWPVFYFFNQ